MFHAVDHAVPHRPDRFEIVLLFEPVNQNICRRPVIRSGDAKAFRLILGRGIERQIRPAQADAVNLSIQPAFQRFFNVVERKLDTRRAAIDGQDGLH